MLTSTNVTTPLVCHKPSRCINSKPCKTLAKGAAASLFTLSCSAAGTAVMYFLTSSMDEPLTFGESVASGGMMGGFAGFATIILCYACTLKNNAT